MKISNIVRKVFCVHSHSEFQPIAGVQSVLSCLNVPSMIWWSNRCHSSGSTGRSSSGRHQEYSTLHTLLRYTPLCERKLVRGPLCSAASAVEIRKPCYLQSLDSSRAIRSMVSYVLAAHTRCAVDSMGSAAAC